MFEQRAIAWDVNATEWDCEGEGHGPLHRKEARWIISGGCACSSCVIEY